MSYMACKTRPILQKFSPSDTIAIGSSSVALMFDATLPVRHASPSILGWIEGATLRCSLCVIVGSSVRCTCLRVSGIVSDAGSGVDPSLHTLHSDNVSVG